MTKALQINKGFEQGINELLRFLLESGKISAVLTLKKMSKDDAIAYSLITKVDELSDAVPLYPLMPVSGGKLLSRFTLKGPSKKPVLAVISPCEVRAFIELVKREQGSLENIFILSFTCGGVYPQEMAADQSVEKQLPSYWESVKKGNIPQNLRPVCKACEEFVPYTADMTIDLIGNTSLDKQSVILLHTKKAEELVQGMKAEVITTDIEKARLDTFKSKREAEKKKLYTEIGEKTKDMDGLIDIFGRCIGCHGCMRVCPICYCKLCEFESSDAEYKPSNYESELNKRKGIRVPPGTIYFHLGRLSHIGISCVACGLCEDVCPADIPVSVIFKKIGESVQGIFEYVAGKDVEEEIPLTTFEKEELSEIED